MNIHKTGRWIDFIPLIVFAWFSRVAACKTENAWNYSFYAGAALAILVLAYAWYRKSDVDYVAVGADAFLIYGSAGFLAFPVLLEPYSYFQQSVIFLWILIVGIITTFTRPEGFLQQETHRYTEKSLRGSLMLLALTAVCFIVSFALIKYFNVGTALGTIVPFVALLYGRNFIKESL